MEKTGRMKEGKLLLAATLLVCILVLTLFSGCGKARVYRVGILSGLDYVMVIFDGFKAQMEEMGYIEGENIVYDFQRSNVKLDEYEEILAKFNKDRVDLIFGYPTEAAIAAKQATKTVKSRLSLTLPTLRRMAYRLV